MKNKNIYTGILKVGADNSDKFMTAQEIIDELKKKGFNTKKYNTMIIKIIQRNFSSQSRMYEPNHSTSEYLINDSALFNLLQYESLEEASRSSKLALYLSFGAFIISIILLIIELFK